MIVYLISVSFLLFFNSKSFLSLICILDFSFSRFQIYLFIYISTCCIFVCYDYLFNFCSFLCFIYSLIVKDFFHLKLDLHNRFQFYSS